MSVRLITGIPAQVPLCGEGCERPAVLQIGEGDPDEALVYCEPCLVERLCFADEIRISVEGFGWRAPADVDERFRRTDA